MVITEDLLVLSERHQALFDNHPYGVFTFGMDGQFQSCNAAMERVTGYTADHLQGFHFNLFVELGYRAQTQAAFDRARNGEAITYETMDTHASGHPYSLEVTNFPVTIKEQIVGEYGICRDITDRKEQEAQITYQATHDLLTGLPNEASFKEKLRDALAADGERGSLVAMCLGLDGFKPINKELGHPVGDQILMTSSRRSQRESERHYNVRNGRATPIAMKIPPQTRLKVRPTFRNQCRIRLAELARTNSTKHSVATNVVAITTN